MNNLVSTGSSTIATRSVVERIIVIRTASLTGVAQIVVVTYPLAPALKVRPNDRLRMLGTILNVTRCFINLSTCVGHLLICDNSFIPVPFVLRRNSKENGSGGIWVLKVSIHGYSFIAVYSQTVIWDLSSQLR
jgi:hypothetical protein